MDNNEISISQALNQLQSWLNAREYDKVIQGAQEILQIEVGNPRAMALMRKAEEERHANIGGTPMAEATPAPEQEPTPEPEPKPEPAFEPEEKPKQEEKVEEAFEKTFGGFDDGNSRVYKNDNRKHFLAMLIPAILVVMIGGSIIWYISERQREDIISDIEDNESKSNEYIEENEDRANDLMEMARVIDAFKDEHGAYPSKDQIEQILVDSDAFSKVPSDPRDGELDKAGKTFGYIYAVYDTEEGDNMEYIISAIFEGDKGFAYPWSRGGSVNDHPDYRDPDSNNVVLIGGDGKSGEESKPKVKVKR
jgi:hypothetical protein